MLHLKKLFTEGLVQMAVLLSLSGLGVDVDLESYLPPLWHDAAFAPMKPHDRRGGLYPKSVDLQELLAAPRLHKQVHSLHRLQVPDAVLETWLVQQEPLERPAQAQREWSDLPVQPRAADREEEEDEEGGSVASGVPSSNPQLLWPPVIPLELPPTAEDLELLWQDVSFLLEDEGTDLESVSLNGSPHGDLLGSRVLLPLTPSAELDDYTSVPTTSFTLDSLPLSLNSSDLPTEDPFKDFLESLNNISTTLNFGLLPEHPLLEDEPEAFDVDPTPPSSTHASDGKMSQECLEYSSSDVLLGQEEEEEDLPSLLTELLGDATLLDDMNLLDLDLEEGFGSKLADKLEKGFYRDVTQQEEEEEDHMGIQEDAEEVDSDSGLSLDCSHSPASSGASIGSSSYSSSSSSTPMSCTSSDRTVFSKDEDRSEGSLDSEGEVTIKQYVVEEEEGAVGGSPGFGKHLPVISEDHKEFHGFPSWLEHVGHDHTYNQMHPRKTSSALSSGNARHHGHSCARLWSRSERRAHSLKIPFSTELMVNLPVDQFNEMLSDCQLSEEQLTLVKNIRRRGKNKIAAQNCRRRKHDILLGLEEDVSVLRRRHSTLLRENRDALRRLQQMKHRLGVLYQEVLSELRDEEAGLNAAEFTLLFGPDGKLAEDKSSQKQRRKKK